MEISEIKQRLTLAMVLNHYGLKADKSHRISCPFHEDKTPSMQLLDIPGMLTHYSGHVDPPEWFC
jgi:hypothetical protein